MICRLSTGLLLAAVFAVLAGCDNSGTTPAAPPPAAGTAASLQVLVSNPQMPSSGATTVNVSATVLSASGQAIAGKAVIFSSGGDTAFFSAVSGGGVSDANGLVTATLNLGANKANRTISISASADAATGTNSVDVIGTTITISGNSSLTFGASTTLTFTLKDSAGVALPGIPMTLSSATGNTIVPNPATGITNAAGQITAVITATVVTSPDTITATAAGATKTQALTVSGSSFAFTAPAAPVAPATTIDIPLSTLTTFTVHWTNSGVPAAGQVSFATSRGTITGPNPATVNGAGDASVQISSTSAGPAIVTASGPAGTPSATLSNVVFVATTASSVTVQAVPSTIQFTTGVGSQTSNSSTISAVVRDVVNNLVKNASVNFSIVLDPSGGQLTAATGITDATGSASVTYIAGGTSSPQNGVTLSATVTAINGIAIAPITGTTALTVSGQSLLVRLGTDNLVESAPPLNTKIYVAVVTDAAGNAIAGANVKFALRPGRYEKGFYVLPGAAPAPQVWTQTVNALCANEDVNFNGNLDPGEDFNGNGTLEPPGAATVNPTATTDAFGIATATITYPKNYATWTEVILEARTTVTSNDPPSLATFFLPGLASDYTNLTVSPPGDLSPFGIAGSCANPL